MSRNRLAAFSDGVIAIIMAALLNLAPVFGSYVLSFVFIRIYWNNHHHLLRSPSTAWS